MTSKKTDITQILSEGFEMDFFNPIIIKETERTYPIKINVWDNWLPFAFSGFKKIEEKTQKEGKSIHSFASIGTSNGADSIGANFAFPFLKKIVLCDVEKEIVAVAEENVRMHCKNKEIITGIGSLCEPLNGLKVDLIYENLPNIPNGGDVTKGYKIASKYDARILENFNIPEQYKKSLLGIHYVFLLQTKEHLNDGGSAILSIGGRVPYNLIKSMVECLGYVCEPLVVGFKVQTEPWEIYDDYAKAEESLCPFIFYRYKEVLKELNLNESGIIGEGSEQKIRNHRITANQALQEYLSNNYTKIGHTVYIIRALKKS